MGVAVMMDFSTFITQLDQVLARESVPSTDVVYVPVTFSTHDQHLSIALNTFQTSFNQGANAYDVASILDRIRMLVGVELAERPRSRWPTDRPTTNLTITPYKVVRVIPVDMHQYRVN